MKTIKAMQKATLVKGEFTSSEASNIINSLITERVNERKIKRLQTNIGSDCCDIKKLDTEIGELLTDKKNIQNLIEAAKQAGLKLSIQTTLQISIVD